MKYLKKELTDETKAQILPTLLTHYPRLKDQVVCDFCGEDNPAFVYGAVRSSTGMARRCWRWCACSPCSILVDNNQWPELVERAKPTMKLLLERSGVSIPNGIVVAALLKSFQTFVEDVERVIDA